MRQILLCTLLLLGFVITGKAQCSEDFYELALGKAGQDIVLVRDFNIKIKESSKRNPAPLAKYTVYMQVGITYRFLIAKDPSSTDSPILQLFDRNQLLGSTGVCNHPGDTCKFEYLCLRSGNYQVISSFSNNLGGCAVGFMAMVTNDAFYLSGIQKPQNEKYILYLGVETQLKFITDNSAFKREEITTSNGEVFKKDSAYFIRPSKPGNAHVSVKLYSTLDSLIEKTEQDFTVLPLPEPTIFIDGQEKNYLQPSIMGYFVKLEVKPSVYHIRSFYLSEEPNVRTGFYSENEYLTTDMISWIKSLFPMKKIYFNEIEIELPSGEHKLINWVLYYIR